ncbi:MAG: DUF971 domain-containing protein [Deltaproteobacteria bacterium]|jgi:DUF971 family protein|nr:DUF971 domain-containing protein [Deltaproteobacteria bacterium]
MLDNAPKSIRKIKDSQNDSIGIGIEIVWDNDNHNVLDSVFLRRHCPCADCEEIRVKNKLGEDRVSGGADFSDKATKVSNTSSLRVVASSFEQQTNLIEIKLVGNYAIAILWGDGHKNGIYSFEYLRELCDYIKI